MCSDENIKSKLPPSFTDDNILKEKLRCSFSEKHFQDVIESMVALHFHKNNAGILYLENFLPSIKDKFFKSMLKAVINGFSPEKLRETANKGKEKALKKTEEFYNIITDGCIMIHSNYSVQSIIDYYNLSLNLQLSKNNNSSTELNSESNNDTDNNENSNSNNENNSNTDNVNNCSIHNWNDYNEEIIKTIILVADKAHRQGITAVEQDLTKIDNQFLISLLFLIINGADIETLKHTAELGTKHILSEKEKYYNIIIEGCIILQKSGSLVGELVNNLSCLTCIIGEKPPAWIFEYLSDLILQTMNEAKPKKNEGEENKYSDIINQDELDSMIKVISETDD